MSQGDAQGCPRQLSSGQAGLVREKQLKNSNTAFVYWGGHKGTEGRSYQAVTSGSKMDVITLVLCLLMFKWPVSLCWQE